MRRPALRLLILVPILTLAAVPGRAENLIRVAGFRASTDDAYSVSRSAGFSFGHGMIVRIDEEAILDTDPVDGFLIGWEHRLASGVAFGLTVGRSQLDLPLHWRQTITDAFDPSDIDLRRRRLRLAEVELVPVLVDLRHLWSPSPRVDVSIGATLGALFVDAEPELDADWDGFSFLTWAEPGTEGELAPVDVDDDLTVGAVGHIELKLGQERFRPYFQVRWLDFDLDVRAARGLGQLGIGPLWIELGVGWRM